MRSVVRFSAACLLSAFAVAPLAAQAPGYDIVIKGGRVIDPASGRDEIADIGINGSTIAAISTTPLKGKRMLDAKGEVVSPGFIDYHAHGQDIESQRYKLLDGVTSAFEMEIGAMPIGNFYAAKQGKSLINYGATANFDCAHTMVLSDKTCDGSGWVSTRAITLSTAALSTSPTPEQEDKILAITAREIEAGALGIGIGLEYAPGMGRREIFRTFQLAAKYGVPVFVHVRMREKSRGSGIAIAVADELIADAAAAGASLQIVHVTSTSLEDAPTVIQVIKGAAAHGVQVTTEAYPYEAGATAIGDEFFADGWQDRSHITYKDLEWTETGERLTKETFEKYRKEKPEGGVIVFMIPQASIDAAMADPFVTIASDGGAMSEPKTHPRGAGTFARVLAVYVRERKLLDLKTALAKMTIMPARKLETVAPVMARKGRLQVGADADIDVFDPATVKDNATYEDPHQVSTGFRYIIVGGKLMAENGKITPGLFPGVGIKRGDR